jgi:acetyltransferase-like isoleucine patch superfamily enzyme
MIHPSSEVHSKKIGDNTIIWQFCVVLNGAQIGKDCNINSFVFIENDVVIGNRVTIKPGVQIWDGVCIEDDVFIGPNVTFTNDKTPRSKQYPKSFSKTIIKTGASIGANSTLLSNIEVGCYALIGAGSVVTKSVIPHALVIGNPAIQIGWVDYNGERLIHLNKTELSNSKEEIWVLTKNGIKKQ